MLIAEDNFLLERDEWISINTSGLAVENEIMIRLSL